MKSISVIGLGAVGSATAIGFAKLGYSVVGVDIIKSKIDKTDSEIDSMVYELYGLSEEEIAIVESSNS